MYVAKFGDNIHVLHCCQKKTQATPKRDIDLARKRYANLKREFGK
jgi:phage-related protein